MAKKYVIYNQKNLLIVDDWNECKSRTHGVSNVKFKSFKETEKDDMIYWFLENILTENEDLKNTLLLELINLFDISNIDKYIENNGFSTEKKDNNELQQYLENLYKNPNNFIAFVDGSYNIDTIEYSYGVCIVNSNKVIYEKANKFKDQNAMRQINGELKASLIACNFAIENNLSEIYIAYDYTGIKMFATKEWKSKSPAINYYIEEMQKIMSKIKVNFIKIPAHSNFEYNEQADLLAKKVLNIKK